MAENGTPALSTVCVCHFYGFASPQQCIIKLCKNLNLNLVHAHLHAFEPLDTCQSILIHFIEFSYNF